MEPVSFGLALVAETRTLASSIKNRFENYRKGPKAFKSVSDKAGRLEVHIGEVEAQLQAFPNVLPPSTSIIINDTFHEVRDILTASSRIIESFLSKAFAGSSSSTKAQLKSKLYQVFRASALSSEMSTLEENINKAPDKLLHLTLALGTALKIQEKQNPGETDVFRVVKNTPAFANTVNLDFDSKDASDRLTTPEGRLKHSVLYISSSSTVSAATGAKAKGRVLLRAHGVVGMAGVGKTTALRGLAFDEDIQRRFPDGILFITLGQAATVESVVRELCNVLERSGAETIVATARSSSSLRDAVECAVPWFEGKVCLFLIDDVWPTASCKTGFFSDLRQLLRESPDSRMAITTRSVTIAQYAGCAVDFGSRDPLGTVSVNVFLAHANGQGDRNDLEMGDRNMRDSVSKILSICAGLPIALAVAGCAVAFLTRVYSDFDSACDAYATGLEKKRSGIGGETTMEGRSLNAGILLSLEFLDAEFSNRKLVESSVAISELYTSLCVLNNQAFVPVSVLGRLWRMDDTIAMKVVTMFCDMSLASLQVRRAPSGGVEEAGILLHDLQLEFCQQQAVNANKSRYWHARLLDGYLQGSDDLLPDEHTSDKAYSILTTTPRQWWGKAVPEDGYIHENITRHLLCAKKYVELAALLLDGRWTEMRATIGGIVALELDFDHLDSFYAEARGSEQDKHAASELRQTYKRIFQTTQVSWGRIKNWKTFQFYVCGRLSNVRESNGIVGAFLGSLEAITAKPYLLPVRSFFPEMSGSLVAEIPIGDICLCVSCSPCGRYIAAGYTEGVVIANSKTCEILKRTGGCNVTSVEFAAESTKIYFGNGWTVMNWKWESSDAPVEVFGGRISGVGNEFFVTSDEKMIFRKTGDGKMDIWDAETGDRTAELVGKCPVICFAVHEGSQKIALGLGDRAVQVLDAVTKQISFEDSEAHEEAIRCICFSPNGRYVATGSCDNTARVWNTRTRTSKRFEGHEKTVACVSFSPDGTHIASGSWDGTIRLWDIESGNCLGTSRIAGAYLQSLEITPDGRLIVSGTSDGFVRIWDARLSTELEARGDWHRSAVFGVAISQNGRRVASASMDGTVRLWDSETGEPIGVPMKGHKDSAWCVSFSPDGRHVISGSDDCTLRLWDTETCTQIGKNFEGHSERVTFVSFSCDGLRVASVSVDKTARIWHAKTHEQIGEPLMGHSMHAECVSESADGRHVVSRDWVLETKIWNHLSRSILWVSSAGGGLRSTGTSNDGKKCESMFENEWATFENEISDEEAERIIRSCGHRTPHLWPSSFPGFTSELFVHERHVYSSWDGEQVLHMKFDLNEFTDWVYHSERKVLAIALHSGAVAICKLLT